MNLGALLSATWSASHLASEKDYMVRIGVQREHVGIGYWGTMVWRQHSGVAYLHVGDHVAGA